jgi:nucleoid DNA-binding protein
MNKNELVAAVAEKSGISKGDATSAVEAVFETITGELKNGGDVRLIGFGNFTFRVAKLPRAATRRPARKSTFLPATCRSSRPARVSRTPATKPFHGSSIRSPGVTARAFCCPAAVRRQGKKPGEAQAGRYVRYACPSG